MSGLDLGTLAGYHRHDLRNEMRKCRVTGVVGPQAKAKPEVTHPGAGIRYTVGIAVERWGVRLQGHHGLQEQS